MAKPKSICTAVVLIIAAVLPVAVLGEAQNEQAAIDQEDQHWWSGFGPEGMDGPVRALAWWQGSIVAAGQFSEAGGHQVGGIALWDGVAWDDLAGGMSLGSGFDVPDVQAIHSYRDMLVVGGHFSEAGGGAVSNIAFWDGQSWHALGDGIDGSVSDLETYQGELIAVGVFGRAGDVEAAGVARWNGSAWSSMGGRFSSFFERAPSSAVVFRDELIVGGSFYPEGAAPYDGLARWDGLRWSGLGSGVRGRVVAMIVQDSALVVAGSFEEAGGVSVQNIARWDGFSWLPMGEGIEGGVTALGLHEGRIIAASSATLWVWNGTSWDQLSPEPINQVLATATIDGDLIVGGDFIRVEDVALNGIARWDGVHWQRWSASGMGTDREVNSLTVFDGDLIAGGSFQHAGAAAVGPVARWNGSGWTGLGTWNCAWNNDRWNTVRALCSYEGNLVAGGYFACAEPGPEGLITQWNGKEWVPLADGVKSGLGTGSVHALIVLDNMLIVGGTFTEADGLPVNNIAAWDGQVWAPLGSGTNGLVTSLAVHDGSLIVGGEFTEAGGVPANNVAAWDGQLWSPLGSGLSNLRRVDALLAHEGGLYAGGGDLEGPDPNPVWRWEGEEWVPLRGHTSGGWEGVTQHEYAEVTSLVSYGNRVVAAGYTYNSRVSRVLWFFGLSCGQRF